MRQSRVIRRSRREFLQSSISACAAGPAAWWSCTAPDCAGATAANDQIQLGVIGTGVRGKYLIGNLPQSARVVAICDCATSRMAETLQPTGDFVSVLARFVENDAVRCATYQDYRRMFDRQKLDAVIIATPDHHHSLAAMLALDAGLDVYLEKPLTVSIREGRLLADKVRQSGRVLQVGSQQRTMEMNRFGWEFIRGGGLGRISRVELPNFPGPIDEPAFPKEETPAGLDWNVFLGPTKMRPHDRRIWVKDAFKVGDLSVHREKGAQ